MILCGLLLPLAGYLLYLAWLNHRDYPVLVSGVDDGIGLLAGLSGFVLLGGPLLLTRILDQLLLGWLASAGPAPLTPEQAARVLSALYFAGVVCVVLYLFTRQRQLTCLYNADVEQVEEALEGIFTVRGLDPLRSERIYFFQQGEDEVVLQVEYTSTFHNVTLRWDPAAGKLREDVEADLSRMLAKSPSGANEVPFWFALAGLFLLGMAGMALILSFVRSAL